MANPTESPTDRFERIAAEFQAATGLLAPGKDQPGAMGGPAYDARLDAFVTWTRERTARVERDAQRYCFLRDNPLGLRAVDGNAGYPPAPAERFDDYVDQAMEDAAHG